MWVVCGFIAYIVLTLLVPPAWVLWPVWRGAQVPRRVNCPAAGCAALVTLDPWLAIRRQALGDRDDHVTYCSRWLGHPNCDQECLREGGVMA